MASTKIGFEQGPIRPPSEAGSLLLRLTRNCPWNRCMFCPVYKGEKFSRRGLEEIRGDIRFLADAVKTIKGLDHGEGNGRSISRRTLSKIQSLYPELIQVAFWLHQGAENVFLQDADSLILPAPEVCETLELLKKTFPSIKRITTYARSRTLLRRSVEDLAMLKEAGLTRIHVGLESGNDTVLELMQKGISGAGHVEAGLRVKEAGLSLSEYVLIGLGGTDLWQEHALDTAGVLNRINPDFIRMRTLAVHPAGPLYEMAARGQFKALSDDGMVREEKLFIDSLDGIESYLYSDHVLNLLEDVCGQLPGDKGVMQERLLLYLNLPSEDREIFRLGRRTGHFRVLDDRLNQAAASAVKSIHGRLKEEGVTVDSCIRQMLFRYL